MQVKYNVTGAKRKELVKVIADTTGAKAEYKFMPTCNYEIDYFTVTKDGTLLFDDRADSEEVEQVLEAIAAAGFECEPQDGADSEVEEDRNRGQRGTGRRRGAYGGGSEDSLSDAALENLQRIVDSKAALIKKYRHRQPSIEVTDEKVSFLGSRRWTAIPQRHICLVSALCEMARNAKA